MGNSTPYNKRMMNESLSIGDGGNVVQKDDSMLFFEHNSSVPTSLIPTFADDIIAGEFLNIKDECEELFENFKELSKDHDSLKNILSKLLRKCMEVERPSRDKLEKICLNMLISHFHVPEDSVSIEMNLVDAISADNCSAKVNFRPSNIYSHDDIESIISLNSEIEKKNMLKYLSVGYAIKRGYSLLEELSNYGISDELIVLYKKILMLNQYLVFVEDFYDDMDEEHAYEYLLGINCLTFGKPDEKPKISAQGIVFPSLLVESIKGFMDLFSSHGLPKDKEQMKAVLSMTDALTQEPFDMKIGPSLWNRVGVSIDMEYMPYVFMRISKINSDDFSYFMKELLCGTKMGIRIFKNIWEKSIEDFEESEAENGILPTMQTDRNIITDEYMHPDEL